MSATTADTQRAVRASSGPDIEDWRPEEAKFWELTGKRTAEIVPGAKLKVIDGAPHGLFVTHIEQVNAEIRAFARA